MEAIGSLYISIFIEEERKDNREIKKEEIRSSEDHGIFYRNPDNFYLIRNYLKTKETTNFKELKGRGNYKRLKKKLLENDINIYFKDIKPRFLEDNSFVVIKAISPDLLAFNFGYRNIATYHEKKSLNISNKRLDIPHPFA